MGYRYVRTLRGAISLIAKALDMPYDDIAVYIGDGKKAVFEKIKERNNREMLFIPDKCGFICAVEY